MNSIKHRHINFVPGAGSRLNKMNITKDIHIEDLVDQKVEAVSYLADHGIKCIACGEPIWGTLEEAAKQKGFSDTEIATFVRELAAL